MFRTFAWKQEEGCLLNDLQHGSLLPQNLPQFPCIICILSFIRFHPTEILPFWIF